MYFLVLYSPYLTSHFIIIKYLNNWLIKRISYRRAGAVPFNFIPPRTSSVLNDCYGTDDSHVATAGANGTHLLHDHLSLAFLFSLLFPFPASSLSVPSPPLICLCPSVLTEVVLWHFWHLGPKRLLLPYLPYWWAIALSWFLSEFIWSLN